MLKQSIIVIILLCTLMGCDDKANLIHSSQPLYSSISGFVYDITTFKTLPGARITVLDQKETFSDTSGYFLLDSISIGQIILVTQKDFYDYDTTEIVLMSQDTSFKNVFLEPLRIISYRLLATVTDIRGKPAINVSIADKIQGFISYQIDAQDVLSTDSKTGYYPQVDKSCRAEFIINNTSYINSMYQDTLFYVAVQNDYENIFFFHFYDELYFGPFVDYQFKDSLSLTRLKLVIDLQDNTSEVFNDDTLPRYIDFERFNFRILWMYASTIDSSWTIDAEINEFYFEMPNKPM